MLGLAQPVPAPTSMNDGETSSVVDSDRCSNKVVVVKRRRIQWSSTLEADLAWYDDAITLPMRQRRRKELVQLWHELHSELPTLGIALASVSVGSINWVMCWLHCQQSCHWALVWRPLRFVGRSLLNHGGHKPRVGQKEKPSLTMSSLLWKSHTIGQADPGSPSTGDLWFCNL